MTDGSARSQKDRVHTIILEHLRPHRGAFLHHAMDTGEPVIGVVALGQGTDASLLCKLAKASQREDDIDVLLWRSDVVANVSHAQALFRRIRRDDTQRRQALARLAQVAYSLLIGQFSRVVRILIVTVDPPRAKERDSGLTQRLAQLGER